MEMNGEQIIKNGKNTPKGIMWAYVICILAIIIAAGVMTYREENEKPTAIDFTTEGAVGMETDKYAYLKVEGLTDEVAIYGNVENESDSTNDRYYIAVSGKYLYIVDLNYDTIDLLKPLQDYTYSEGENDVQPEPVTIYGMTESVPDELKKMIVDYYNAAVGEEYKITVDQFEMYFGSVLLNVRRQPVNTVLEEVVIIFAFIGAFVVVIMHIAISIINARTKKYLKKNGYEEDLAHQLDDFVEEKHYKEKVILTRDYFVDIKNGFTAFKYSDIKWVHIHNLKYYGTITVSSSIVVHLNDGKTKFQCVEIKGDATDEFLEIFNKICEKAPTDALKGYTQENVKAYKEYRKSLKKNTL